MAENSYIQWRNSATPIFNDEYAISGSLGADLDGTKSRKLVKTADNAQTIGGGETTITTTTPGRVEGADTVTTTTSYVAVSADADVQTGKNVTFLGLQIIDANGNTSTDVNCMISLDNGSTSHIKLTGVGSAIAIPIDGISSDNIEFKSSGASYTCKIKYVVQTSDGV